MTEEQVIKFVKALEAENATARRHYDNDAMQALLRKREILSQQLLSLGITDSRVMNVIKGLP